MRAPNKYGERNRRRIDFLKTGLLPVFLFSAAVFLFFSIFFYAVLPVQAGADEGRLPIILIDGDEIYVRSGSSYSLLQGYQIYVKGADTEGSRIWIELRRNGVFLEDAIVSEGNNYVYSNNSTEILNLTVDTIYGGADGVLVKFSPVYQYLNPRLPMPQKPEVPSASGSDNNSSIPPVFENKAEGFDVSLFLLSIGAVFLVIGFFAGLYKKK